MDCTPPFPSVCGIFQARILEWVAFLCSLTFLGPWLLQQQVWEMWGKRNPGNSAVMWFMGAEEPGIFPTQGSNPHFLPSRWILSLPLSCLPGKPSSWNDDCLCRSSLCALLAGSMVGKAWVGKPEENSRCGNCRWVYPLWAGAAAVAAADTLFSCGWPSGHSHNAAIKQPQVELIYACRTKACGQASTSWCARTVL